VAIILHSTQYRQMHERIGGENGIWGKLDDKNTGNSVQKWKSGINNSAEIFLGDKIMKTIKSTVSLCAVYPYFIL